MERKAILIADDNEFLRDLLKDFLKELFCFSSMIDIFVAKDGREAIEILKKEGERISVVLTDYDMPLNSGLEVASYIRDNLSHIKVILVTASSDVELVVAAKLAGVWYFMRKPMEIQKVGDVVLQAFARTA